ncbi:hypothetical protein BC936DRAFT_145502 [Jimgerdemannia flammicorona]|uniref:Uncharacterized protein n=1 Tax=Jimgerdemannia flammicorona TaxID=994334 RepID=A0A433D9U8_9FUNG|nr:hypothetical protein BC936DRAFT_145502 [Jimgerdemannia flammicorona]
MRCGLGFGPLDKDFMVVVHIRSDGRLIFGVYLGPHRSTKEPDTVDHNSRLVEESNIRECVAD